MIKLNVLYPYTEGGRFDHAYYRDKHMPFVAQKLGGACLYYSIDKGLAGAGPGAPTPYFGACSIFCESTDSLQKALAPVAKDIIGDIKNYTDTEPIMWISDVVVERSR
ncbi:EthD family reductase [Ramlibacter sp. G-1-2-2]|uniref:EthD family reductase n=1 Tax=Ramlibacter agri TaxID=2728837 RepID=A0A848HAX8_9BURK|nr:EthD family reductase [Ramlibacter agri]NML47202.1 EthD family reductase [Ramlibacter agri]